MTTRRENEVHLSTPVFGLACESVKRCREEYPWDQLLACADRHALQAWLDGRGPLLQSQSCRGCAEEAWNEEGRGRRGCERKVCG